MSYEDAMSSIQRWIALVCVPILVMALLALNFCQHREEIKNYNKNHLVLLDNQKQALVTNKLILDNQITIEYHLTKTLETLASIKKIDEDLKKDTETLLNVISHSKVNR